MKAYKFFKYKIFSQIKVIFYKYFLNTQYEFRKIKSSKLIIHHHAGLGDAIICNGLVNYLSKDYNIYLAAYCNIYNHLEYLYSENENVKLLSYEDPKEIYNNSDLPILRIGFEKNKKSFNTSFYEQINLPYEISFDYFHIPNDENRVDKIYNHLLSHYGVNGDYILIHRTSSYGEVDLEIENSLPRVFVEKETDIFKNIFLYSKLIQNANEIHCVDSSFLHLVERVDTQAELFFHAYKTQNQISEKLFLKKNWNIINKKNEN